MTDHRYTVRLRSIYGFLLFIIDLFFLLFSCFLAYYLRFYTDIFGTTTISHSISGQYLFYSLIITGSIIVLFAVFKLYSINKIYRDLYYYLELIIILITGIVIIYFSARLMGGFYFSRIWIGLFSVFGVISIVVSRFILAMITRAVFKKSGVACERLIISFLDYLRVFKKNTRIKKKITYGIILVINDIIFLGIAFYLSFYLRFNTGMFAESQVVYFIETNYLFYSVIFIISALLIFLLYRLYNWDNIYRGSGYYSRIVRGMIINIIVIILSGYIFELFTFSRKWILILFILSLVFIYISRLLIDMISIRLIRRIQTTSSTIIIGIGENSKRIEDSFKKYSFEDNKILGYVEYKKRLDEDKEYSRDFDILGYLEDLREIIYKHKIQRVIISSPEYKYFELLEMLEKLKGIDVSVLVFPGFFEFSIKRMNMREIAGIPLMQVSNIGFFGVNLFLKNFIDYFLGSIIFVLFIPIYLIIGMAIKLDSKGPVFYQQERYTKDCRTFYMYKFRSMYADAGERLKELEEYNEAEGPIFKMKKDPRITRVGRFIRRFSIDELPQIINVLKGELSLVGPRPPLPKEVDQYEDWELRRMNVKQGITGLWQISGRSELSFEEMARLDLYYIQNWSIEMDIKILLRTIPTVLFGKGAY
ncbi:MAG: sugar transferase [Actinobacteria bacterium]|nr:sugar transferase [Actinomycetota bacterium]